jgi:hypothetical protein
MIIFLGCQLPGASSDLPGSRDGSGRSVSGWPIEAPRYEPERPVRLSRSASLFGLAPDGVCRARPVTRPAGELLPRRFTLTAAVAASVTTEAVYFLWHCPYPSRAQRPGRWALPTIAPFGVRTFLRGMSPVPSRWASFPAPELESRRRGDHRARHGPPSHHTGQARAKQPAVITSRRVETMPGTERDGYNRGLLRARFLF